MPLERDCLNADAKAVPSVGFILIFLSLRGHLNEFITAD